MKPLPTPTRRQLLISVRDAAEARDALAGGADIVDAKEPLAGALGAVPLPVLHAVVDAVRGASPAVPVSATIGDLGDASIEAVLTRVHTTAACGVDIVKVGLAPGACAPGLVEALGALRGLRVVPVLIADDGLDEALLSRVLLQPFPAVILDTDDKARGSLLDVLDLASLDRFVRRVQEAGRHAGLAGALRAHHVPRLQALEADIVGFRGAACDGERAGPLNVAKVRALATALQAPFATVPVGTPRAVIEPV